MSLTDALAWRESKELKKVSTSIGTGILEVCECPESVAVEWLYTHIPSVKQTDRRDRHGCLCTCMDTHDVPTYKHRSKKLEVRNKESHRLSYIHAHVCTHEHTYIDTHTCAHTQIPTLPNPFHCSVTLSGHSQTSGIRCQSI